ncbi:MAG: type I-B CRISPR-associated protein Cas5b [bacterium]
MNYKEVLIFDISSEYGHFRKYNTTTSPLTYSIPTRTAIAGMLGAVLGMEREIEGGVFSEGSIPVQEFFSKKNADIAVQIINPVKKENVAINLINTKTSFYDLTRAKHTQIEFELLKNPKYRVFLNLRDVDTFKKLGKKIKSRQHHFSPYLGLSQFTATLDFVGLEKAYLMENKEFHLVEIHTAVSLSKLKGEQPIDFDDSAIYSANNMPIEMNKNREILEYSEVLIERNGLPLKVRTETYYKIENIANILFL